MSYPLTNLVAQYEPWRWGYSDGDVINTTTKKIIDSSGNGHDLTDFVAGSTVLYKTNILGSLAVVRFPGIHGDPGLASGLFSTGSTAPGTIAGVIIPRETNVTGIAFAFHDGGASGGASSHNGNQVYITSGSPFTGFWTNAGGSGFGTGSNTVTPVSGTAYVVWIDYVASGTNHLRVNAAGAGSVAGQSLYASMLRFSIGGLPPNVACWQFDLAALFIYSAVVTGQDATDLDNYLAGLQAGNIAYTDSMPAGSYAITGQAEHDQIRDAMAKGAYAATGQAEHDQIRDAMALGAYAVTGYPFAGEEVISPLVGGHELGVSWFDDLMWLDT